MSLLMDTQTNRFWARVDFLATGEIVLHIPEECELPIRVLVSRGGRSTEYEPNNSEKPNNCEHITEDGVTCAKYPACDDCLDNPLNKVKGSERLVKGSEQRVADRKTEPQIDGAIDEARFKAHCMNCQRDVADIKCLDCDGDKYFIPDEPQTDCSWK